MTRKAAPGNPEPLLISDREEDHCCFFCLLKALSAWKYWMP